MTLIKLANKHYKNKNFNEAKRLYKKGLSEYPKISRSLELLIKKCEQAEFLEIPRSIEENLNESPNTANVQLICVGLVRDEDDIISQWLEHLVKIFDQILIVDHRSIDGTREKFISAAEAEPKIKLYFYDEDKYLQSDLMNFITSKELISGANDWVFLLDADEFIEIESSEKLRDILGKVQGGVISLPWVNLIPANYDEKNIFTRDFFRPPKASNTSKIAFKPACLSSYVIQQGNHFIKASDHGPNLDAEIIDISILHIPIRSRDQLIKKLSGGLESYRALGDRRKKNEGAHWDFYNQQLSNGVVKDSQINGFLIDYGNYKNLAHEVTTDQLISMGYEKYQFLQSNEYIFSSPQKMQKIKKVPLLHSQDLGNLLSFSKKLVKIDFDSQTGRADYDKEKYQALGHSKTTSNCLQLGWLGNFKLSKKLSFDSASFLRSQNLTINIFEKFLSSHVFKGELLFFISSEEYLFTPIFIEKFFPTSKIILVSDNDIFRSEAESLYAENGLSRTLVVSHESFSSYKFRYDQDRLCRAEPYEIFFDEIIFLGQPTLSALEAIYSNVKEKIHLNVFAEELPIQSIIDLSNKSKNMCILNSFSQVRKSFLGNSYNFEDGLDIVVAMFNAQNYIIECIDSLLDSVSTGIDIIIVDDGSTDASLAIILEAYGSNANVKILTKPNGGCASARNYGRTHSRKTHITFVDADDIVDKRFFLDLYEAALLSAAEVVQGGFDFYDPSKPLPFTPSYEDEVFKNHPKKLINQKECIWLSNEELLGGQPTIWRRVYRRDYLDSKRIYFPENLRAFDDYIFHVLSLYFAKNILMIPSIKLHYRQHPTQDIKQGDERHFNVLFQFRLLLKRSAKDGWTDFAILFDSFIHTIIFALNSLRFDLVTDYAHAAAEFLNDVRLSYGESSIDLIQIKEILNSDFQERWGQLISDSNNQEINYVRSLRIGSSDHPTLIKLYRSLTVQT